MHEPKYTFNDFIAKTLPTFLLGVISTLLALSLLAGCGDPGEPAYIKKVTIVKVESYRAPNSLQDYEVKWKATLSDGSKVTYTSMPTVGDTIIYRYYSRKAE